MLILHSFQLIRDYLPMKNSGQPKEIYQYIIAIMQETNYFLKDQNFIGK